MDNDKLAEIIWKCGWGLVGLGLLAVFGIRGIDLYKYNQKLSNPDSTGVYVIRKGDNVWKDIISINCPDWMRQDDYLSQLEKMNKKKNSKFDPNKVQPGDSIGFPIYLDKK